ncbi:MAG: GntR family transcriptional regulator [Clostridiales bacterium]|nr:GntR family transcriptional regulator [Clostridiales bacterium]
MQIQIDFDSEEALYMQLRNQIIYGIATRQYREGDSLPSVRQLAETIGINMHTVNKAYAVLREEGLLRLGRRTGAVIAVDLNKLKALEEMRDQLGLIVAKGFCKGITRDEIHQLIDDIYSEFE